VTRIDHQEAARLVSTTPRGAPRRRAAAFARARSSREAVTKGLARIIDRAAVDARSPIDRAPGRGGDVDRDARERESDHACSLSA
jgi:hypothetical protein